MAGLARRAELCVCGRWFSRRRSDWSLALFSEGSIIETGGHQVLINLRATRGVSLIGTLGKLGETEKSSETEERKQTSQTR